MHADKAKKKKNQCVDYGGDDNNGEDNNCKLSYTMYTITRFIVIVTVASVAISIISAITLMFCQLLMIFLDNNYIRQRPQ